MAGRCSTGAVHDYNRNVSRICFPGRKENRFRDLLNSCIIVSNYTTVEKVSENLMNFEKLKANWQAHRA